MTRPRLSIIPANAATDQRLKPRDLQVLCVLGRHTDDLGWCRRSQVKMSKEMDCARSTVFASIERLVEHGYVEKHVEKTDSGRDSAHWYRVVLDPVHPDLNASKGDDDPCRYTGTPADISAPPAGPGPAPINDPSLTRERDARARDSGSEGEKTEPETPNEPDDPKKFEHRVKRMADNDVWRGLLGSSTSWTVRQFANLTDAQRAEAEEKAPAYLAWCKREKQKPVALGVYCKDRKWADLPESALELANPEARRHPPDYGPPYGPVWNAWRIGTLVEDGDREAIKFIDREALRRHGYRFGDRWHQCTEAMEAVPVNGDIWSAWRSYFDDRGWPWLPDPGDQPVVYFPKGGPAGMSEFEALIRQADKGDDGGEDQKDLSRS